MNKNLKNFVRAGERAVDDTVAEVARLLKEGRSRDQILSVLTRAAEAVSGDGSVASILVLDADGRLRNGASPRLPEDYLEEIDGITPNPRVGTCAAAAATGRMVMTPDFMADDKWAELRHLPLSIGFLGAWSMPIKRADGTVLGTFGTYFRDCREPRKEEVDAVKKLAGAAAEVISRPAGSKSGQA